MCAEGKYCPQCGHLSLPPVLNATSASHLPIDLLVPPVDAKGVTLQGLTMPHSSVHFVKGPVLQMRLVGIAVHRALRGMDDRKRHQHVPETVLASNDKLTSLVFHEVFENVPQDYQTILCGVVGKFDVHDVTDDYLIVLVSEIEPLDVRLPDFYRSPCAVGSVHIEHQVRVRSRTRPDVPHPDWIGIPDLHPGVVLSLLVTVWH